MPDAIGPNGLLTEEDLQYIVRFATYLSLHERDGFPPYLPEQVCERFSDPQLFNLFREQLERVSKLPPHSGRRHPRRLTARLIDPLFVGFPRRVPLPPGTAFLTASVNVMPESDGLITVRPHLRGQELWWLPYSGGVTRERFAPPAIIEERRARRESS